MREGDLCQLNTDKQTVEARLSSSCPSLVVESGDEADLNLGVGDSPSEARRGQHHANRAQQRGGHVNHRKTRTGRARSPSVSTGESDEDTVSDCVDTGHMRAPVTNVNMGVAGPGLTTGLPNLHKSVSTPSMVQHNDNNLDITGTPNNKLK